MTFLKAGQFYRDRQSGVWCCYRVDKTNEEHCQAFCINTGNKQTEYFYLDGRYDENAKSYKTLIQRVSIPT